MLLPIIIIIIIIRPRQTLRVTLHPQFCGWRVQTSHPPGRSALGVPRRYTSRTNIESS